jgi:hypothetical protein
MIIQYLIGNLVQLQDRSDSCLSQMIFAICISNSHIKMGKRRCMQCIKKLLFWALFVFYLILMTF